MPPNFPLDFIERESYTDHDLVRQVEEDVSRKASEAWEAISELLGDADGQILYEALIGGKIPHVTCGWVQS